MRPKRDPHDDASRTDADTVPRGTTPTWEMEILISGGTVFGLIQLAGLVDDGFFFAANRSSEVIEQFLVPLWIYSKFLMLTLIATFVAHLCLRGYWVALVGVNSVYPGGVDWTQVRGGPISRAFRTAATPPMPLAIERADNRATRVFGIGFGLAMTMLMPVAIVTLALLGTLLFRPWLGEQSGQWIFLGMFLVVLGPWLLLSLLDRRFGKKATPGSRWHSAAIRVYGAYERVGFGRTKNLVMAIFESRGGRLKSAIVLFLISAPLMGLVFLQLFIATGEVDFGGMAGLPDAGRYGTNGVQAQFYASQRSDENTLNPVPVIPDRVIPGPYLPLFVPYLPREHPQALARECPGIAALPPEDQARATLDCYATLHDVRLDGTPVAVPFDAATDPSNGLPGMTMMIPMRALDEGRHELSIADVSRHEKDAADEQRYRIVFWK